MSDYVRWTNPEPPDYPWLTILFCYIVAYSSFVISDKCSKDMCLYNGHIIDKPNVCIFPPVQGLNYDLFCLADEEPVCGDVDGTVVCWETLALPDLDCDKKTSWISSSSLSGELIQPSSQEV